MKALTLLKPALLHDLFQTNPLLAQDWPIVPNIESVQSIDYWAIIEQKSPCEGQTFFHLSF